MSPSLYRRLVKPRQQRIISTLKKKTQVKIFFHCCGAIYEFIPDMIQMGVDILNPVQVSAQSMDSAKLKREFGKDLVFWGGGWTLRISCPLGLPKRSARR
ncbi:uroporphyrinogen decarboxylase family protein [Candidatus Hakubella thermalkaliphila]